MSEELTEQDIINKLEEMVEHDKLAKLAFEDNYEKGDNARVTARRDTRTINVQIMPDAKESVAKSLIDCYQEVAKYNKNNPSEKATIMVNMKDAPVNIKAAIIKEVLKYEDLTDPLMLLNIYNLIKSYNSLDDSYFQSQDIYVNSIEELLDLKLALASDLKDFSRRLSIYFLSLIKSYNKLVFTPADEHVQMPQIYEALILSSDLLTMAGIFAKAPAISTDELMYIDNAYVYMTSLISKSNICAGLMEDFYNSMEAKEEED